ncbi:MAG: hypothetical protein M0Z79_07200 [Nitrospiraceae bacterium]|nr:hypothetical protein [Nitrospiraceae bacterium]
MKNLLPRQELSRLFGEVTFREFAHKDMEEIRRMKPQTLFWLAFSTWKRIVQFNLLPVSAEALDDDIMRKDPEAHVKISKIIGAPVIKDISYVNAAVAGQDRNERTVAEIFAVRVYPNNLHLANVEFERPVRPAEHDAYKDMIGEYTDLFTKVAKNAIRYGKEQGCNYLLLTARLPYHAEIFARAGFLMEDHVSESHAQELGVGIPMIRQL